MAIETDKSSVKGEARQGGLRRLVGVLLSVTGFLWLAKKAGWMPIEHSQSTIFWPVVVIAVGLLIFFSSRQRRTRHTT